MIIIRQAIAQRCARSFCSIVERAGMTAEEIVDLAEQLGLHCDYEDCPEESGAETLLVWHDSDDSTVGGVFIQIHEGQCNWPI